MQFYFFLYSAESAELLALMEADTLGQKRTGAATGLATRILSSPGATDATLFGAGWQAETQLLAMDAVRQLKRVWIGNKRTERRQSLIENRRQHVRGEVVAAGGRAAG